MSPLICLTNITKDYGSVRALDAIDLEIGPGITGLLGPNGAGKTTLIKVLLGLVQTTHGSGEILGHALGSDNRAIRSQVGYLPEDDCYIAGLSGVEMVQFMARLWGQPAVEGLRRSHEMLDFCAMHQERYRDVATYSTGMRQKLKFAQAIVHDPKLLILDEPTAGLDPDERVAMLGRIQMLARQAHKTVILSTHILPDVQAVCDTVVIMAKGKIRLVDKLEVLNRPSSPAWQVSIVGSFDAFAAEVLKGGCEVRQNGNGSLTILGLSDGASARIWDWAKSAEVGLRSITPARNSLEQVFLDAIREGSSNADS